MGQYCHVGETGLVRDLVVYAARSLAEARINSDKIYCNDVKAQAVLCGQTCVFAQGGQASVARGVQWASRGVGRRKQQLQGSGIATNNTKHGTRVAWCHAGRSR